MPITTKEREDGGAQGSVGFFIHEIRPRAENLVTGSSASATATYARGHLLSSFVSTEAVISGSVNEIKAHIGRLGSDAELLGREIAELQLQATSSYPDEAAEAEAGVTAKRAKLAKVKQHIGLLEEFYKHRLE